MVTASSPTAAPASIVGRPVQTTSLDIRDNDHHPITLDNPSFIAPGAEAFERDLPAAEIYLLDAGHFALHKKNDGIAGLILACSWSNIRSD
jgi:hypothetical protein